MGLVTLAFVMVEVDVQFVDRGDRVFSIELVL